MSAVAVSLLGTGVALTLLVPAVVIAVRPPTGRLPVSRLPGWVTLVERAGQVAVIATLALSPHLDRSRPIWLALAAVSLLAYLGWFLGNYVARGRAALRLFEPAWVLPVPLAVLPVVALLALAAGARSATLAASAAAFGAAHIAISRDMSSQLHPSADTEAA